MKESFNFYTLLKRCLVFYIFCFLNVSLAQKIKGIVVDEENIPLEFVSIALLQKSDSLLVKYTSTDRKGTFELADVKGDNTYLFQIYLMTYQTNQRFLSIDKNDMNLGTIKLSREINSLDEVVVNAVVPIKIKQDTISFNTKAFKVRQDDNLEDLVKKLPGVEVEASGAVSAHGQDITKILVDGKEFFSNDPTIALRNLSADAIESIEIIDEGSDESRLTGISDGEKKKIINLVLKPGKKSGYFGKLTAGIGTNDRYSTNFDLNRFTDKTQLAAFGNLNNINNTGATVFKRDGSKDDSSGFLTTGTTGANYSYEIKKDYDLNIDYNYGYSDSEKEEESDRTEFRKNTSFKRLTDEESENISNNHNLNFSLRNRSLKTSYFDFRGGFKKDEREAINSNSSKFFNANGIESTNSASESTSNDNRNNGRLNFSFRQKLKKVGRSFGVNAGLYFFDNDDFNYQNSVTNTNVSNVNNSKTTVQQITRIEKNEGLNLNASLRYLEPLWKNHYLSFQSKLTNNNNSEDIDQSKVINTELQKPLQYELELTKRSFENRLGYEYNLKTFQVNVYGNLESNNELLKLNNINVVDKNYQDLLPEIKLNYDFKKGSNVRFKYEKTIDLPNSNQLNPTINDFNPLSIRVGNPNLSPEKADNYSIRMHSHNFSTTATFFSYLLYKRTTNAIVNSRRVDDNFIQNISYENYGAKSNFTSIFHYGNKIKGLPVRYTLKLRGGTNDHTTIIENEYNDTSSKNASVGLTLNNDNKNNIDIIVGTNYEISKTTYSINDKVNDSFRQNYFTKFDWDITKKFNFNSQFDYTLYTNNNFDSQTVPIWNVALEYAFLKGNRGNLKFQILDILNKSQIIERTSAANYFEETYKESIGTYAMISFTYSIKPPVGKTDKKPKGEYRKRF